MKLLKKIKSLIPISFFTVWSKVPTSDYMVSELLRFSLNYNNSIMKQVFEKKTDLHFRDPSNYPNFSIINDLPFLRGTKSLLLYPIFSDSNEIIAIVEVAGFKHPISESQVEIPTYFSEVFKIVRDFIKLKFFQYHNVPSFIRGISVFLNDIEISSIQHSVNIIAKFLQNSIPCEEVDIFKFDDTSLWLINLKTNTKIGGKEGGFFISNFKKQF